MPNSYTKQRIAFFLFCFLLGSLAFSQTSSLSLSSGSAVEGGSEPLVWFRRRGWLCVAEPFVKRQWRCTCRVAMDTLVRSHRCHFRRGCRRGGAQRREQDPYVQLRQRLGDVHGDRGDRFDDR